MLDKLIPIPCTDREKLLKLRSLLIEIQAAWLDNLFDSGLTFADADIWEKMQAAVCLLERRDDPSAKGIDLKAIASDYSLLEQIFISRKWRYDEVGDKVYLDSDNFNGCDLVFMHRFSPTRIMEQSLVLAQEIKAKRESELANRNIDPIETMRQEIEADPTLTGLEKLNKTRALYDLPPFIQTATGLEVVDSYTDDEVANQGQD